MGKKLIFTEQIFATEPISITLAEFNFTIWSKNREKNSAKNSVFKVIMFSYLFLCKKTKRWIYYFPLEVIKYSIET